MHGLWAALWPARTNVTAISAAAANEFGSGGHRHRVLEVDVFEHGCTGRECGRIRRLQSRF